jgi:hypothetical protein
MKFQGYASNSFRVKRKKHLGNLYYRSLCEITDTHEQTIFAT